MHSFRLYFKGTGEEATLELLRAVGENNQIRCEMMDLTTEGRFDRSNERAAYERDFKPRAKVLKKATGKSITELRSARHGNYYVSVPATLALLDDGVVVSWWQGDEEIHGYLKQVLFGG